MNQLTEETRAMAKRFLERRKHNPTLQPSPECRVAIDLFIAEQQGTQYRCSARYPGNTERREREGR